MKRNRKSKNVFVLLPIILGGLIFILSILNSQNNNIIGIVVGTLLIIILLFCEFNNYSIYIYCITYCQRKI